MINRGYAEGRESSSACGVQPYEQTHREHESRCSLFSGCTRPSQLPTFRSSNLAMSTEAFLSFSPNPDFIPLNKHQSQSVSLKMRHALFVVSCTPGLVFLPALMRLVSTSGTCRLVTLRHVDNELVAADKVLPSNMRGSFILNLWPLTCETRAQLC
jgi:hypothetical protein